jgi:hypothetical protein
VVLRFAGLAFPLAEVGCLFLARAVAAVEAHKASAEQSHVFVSILSWVLAVEVLYDAAL